VASKESPLVHFADVGDKLGLHAAGILQELRQTVEELII
jgi:hypothetical protein